MNQQNIKKRILFLCQGALVAALYVILTLLSAAFGLSSGVIQLRVSEALCVLPIFFPAAVPGLFVGCLIANLLTSGMILLDIVVGSLATLLGALGAYWLRRHPLLVPLPTVIANVALIPPVLIFGYGLPDAWWFMALTVGIGEVLSAYVLGLVLYFALKKRKIAYLH